MNARDLNFHHLRYFWTIAREGSLRRASEVLHVWQPSLSAQPKLLEEALGAPLFNRTTRRLVLTETGQMVAGYAEEIFDLGQELVSATQRRAGQRALRFNVGIADSVPKILVRQQLLPVFRMPTPVHVACREGSLEELALALASHRLDVVIADEPATSALRVKAFNHRVMSSGVSLCAAPALARRLRRRFPASLHGEPAILPVAEMPLRRQLEEWFDAHGVRPRVVAEVVDAALMKDLAAEGLGFIPVYAAIEKEVRATYGLMRVGLAGGLRMEVFAITGERKGQHPGLAALQAGAQWAS